MTDVVAAAVEGYEEITLSTGETLRVRPLNLKVLRALLREVNAGGGVKSGPGMVDTMLKAPAHLAELCGRKPDWFERLSLIDEITIVETIAKISQLEEVLPRFLALQKQIERAIGTSGLETSSRG